MHPQPSFAFFARWRSSICSPDFVLSADISLAILIMGWMFTPGIGAADVDTLLPTAASTLDKFPPRQHRTDKPGYRRNDIQR